MVSYHACSRPRKAWHHARPVQHPCVLSVPISPPPECLSSGRLASAVSKSSCCGIKHTNDNRGLGNVWSTSCLLTAIGDAKPAAALSGSSCTKPQTFATPGLHARFTCHQPARLNQLGISSLFLDRVSCSMPSQNALQPTAQTWAQGRYEALPGCCHMDVVTCMAKQCSQLL